MPNTYENIIDITLLGQFKTLLEGVMDEKDEDAVSSANGYTDTAIANLVNDAPEAYDTLKEIADYLSTHETAYSALVELVGNKITTPNGGTAGQVLKKTANGIEWGDDNDTTYGPATTAVAGLMSANDKTKLDGIDDGADVNVIESVSVNGTELTVTDKGVDIDVPTDVSDLNNDSGYQTAAQVDSAIDAKISLATSAQIQAMFTSGE